MENRQSRDRRQLRRWEAALMAGLAIALLAGTWLDREQAALAEQVVRLHVIANSDSDADQALKLQVRDKVLEAAEEACAGAQTAEEAVDLLRQALPGALAQQGGQGLKPLPEAVLKFFRVNAPDGAQPQHKVFPFPLVRVQRLRLLQHQLAPEIALQIPGVAVAHVAEIGVGPGPEPGIFLQKPVFHVVPGGKAGPGKVGDLVLLIAALL